MLIRQKNIAKNEQSSHTSGGSHHWLTTLIGKKEKYTNEGTDNGLAICV